MRLGLGLALCLVTSGCGTAAPPGIEGHWTRGKTNQVRFAWASGRGCFFGCSLERALMPGTVETLKIDPDVFPPSSVDASEQLRAVSGNPDWLKVEPVAVTVDRDGQGNITRVVPGVRVRVDAAGTTELTVHRADGTLLDRIDVTARSAARVLLSVGDRPESSAPVDFGAGGELSFSARAIDESGRDLSAGFGWTFSVDDPTVATLGYGDRADLSASVTTFGPMEPFSRVVAHGPGVAVLRAHVPEADAEVVLRVYE